MSNNETIRKTIVLNDNSLETEKIVQLGNVYPLNEVNFYKLKNGTSGFRDWSKIILFMSFGWSFKILSIVIIFLIAHASSSKTKEPISLNISEAELVMIGIAWLVCLILYLLGSKFKNDKDKLISDIDSFFSKK